MTDSPNSGLNSTPIVVFDLDGTLVDTAHDLLDSLNHCLEKDGLTAYDSKDIRRLVGAGGRTMIERALSFQNIVANEELIQQKLQEFMHYYADTMPGKSKFYPHVMKAMENLKKAGFLLAVCTNKHEHLARHLLNGLEASHLFAAITGGDTFSYRKPDGRHIISTIELANGELSKAVMIGDSKADILAAQAADIPVIAVDFGYTDQPVQTFKPTKIISSFKELTPELVKSLIG